MRSTTSLIEMYTEDCKWFSIISASETPKGKESACQEAFNENNHCQIVTNYAIQEEREKEFKDTQEATQGIPYKFTHLQYRYKR